MAKKAAKPGPKTRGEVVQTGFKIRPEVLQLARVAAAVAGVRIGLFVERSIEAEVERIERQHGVKLPRDIRAAVAEVDAAREKKRKA
jgi:hypothetical protein